jgi:hypothetical protein
MPACSFSTRKNGIPAPYLSRPIMLDALSSYFSWPTPSGASALNTSPHRLQRICSHSYTVADSGAIPVTRTSTAGVASGYTLPF